jgi:hypothetical protein
MIGREKSETMAPNSVLPESNREEARKSALYLLGED